VEPYLLHLIHAAPSTIRISMKVLIVTVAFPPSPHANAKRPFFVAKAMLEAGWQVEVLTTRDGMPDSAVEVLDHPGCRITRLPDPVSDAKAALTSKPRLARILHLAANGMLWPDFHRLWVRKVIRAIRERQGGYDRVLAFVFPASLFLTGKERDLVDERWTFDMQEPVSTQYKRYPRRSAMQRLLTPRLERLELHTLHRAGAVIFTADTNRRTSIAEGLVPAERAIHIPFFFEPETFSGPTEVASGFQITYFGNFDLRGHRNPATFLESLALFLERNPQARDVTRFVFHGSWLPEHDSIIARHGLMDVVSIREPVPFHEYLVRVRQSPMLLLVAAAEHNLFMPSKVIEYIATGRPVLAFAPKDSEVAGVLTAAGMDQFICGEGDSNEGAAALERLWKLHQQGQMHPTTNRNGNWSASHQIPRYLEAVRAR
jgi:glycosyltransferase involved in cell wall biosynthesis